MFNVFCRVREEFRFFVRVFFFSVLWFVNVVFYVFLVFWRLRFISVGFFFFWEVSGLVFLSIFLGYEYL